jgi:hypothetical protein
LIGGLIIKSPVKKAPKEWPAKGLSPKFDRSAEVLAKKIFEKADVKKPKPKQNIK